MEIWRKKKRERTNIFRSSSCINYCCVMFTDELFNFKIIFFVCLFFVPNCIREESTTNMIFFFSCPFQNSAFCHNANRSKRRGIKDVVMKHPSVKSETFCHWSFNGKFTISNWVSSRHFTKKKLELNGKICQLPLSHTEKMSTMSRTDQWQMSHYFIMTVLPLRTEGCLQKTPSNDYLWGIIETSVGIDRCYWQRFIKIRSSTVGVSFAHDILVFKMFIIYPIDDHLLSFGSVAFQA